MSAVRLDDGHKTLITFALAPAVKLFEKEVTPPGISAGGPIDTTTMRNDEWRSMAPRQLKTLTPVSATVAYATDVYEELQALIGVKQLVTITYPDGFTVTFWGWLEEFTPGSNTEGEQPTASITVQPSNTNAAGNEAAPDFDDIGDVS